MWKIWCDFALGLVVLKQNLQLRKKILTKSGIHAYARRILLNEPFGVFEALN